jgi:type IV pilus assembly protein PilP
VRSQREVVLDQYGLDELKLVGLVTGIRPARAMFIDPGKTGHVVREGQFMGRSEVVQGDSSGTTYEINWRVDRIRETDIVLVREDPANPDAPTATRVIPLRPEDVLASTGR